MDGRTPRLSPWEESYIQGVFVDLERHDSRPPVHPPSPPSPPVHACPPPPLPPALYVFVLHQPTQVLLDWSQKVSASAASRKNLNVKANTAPVTPLTHRSAPAVVQQHQPPPPPPELSEAAQRASTPASRPAATGLGRAANGIPGEGIDLGGPSPLPPPPPASSSSLSPPPVPVVDVPASAALPAPLAGAGGLSTEGGVRVGAQAWGAAGAGAGAAAGGGGNGVAGGSDGANPGLLLPPLSSSSSMMPQRGPGKRGSCRLAVGGVVLRCVCFAWDVGFIGNWPFVVCVCGGTVERGVR